MKHRLVFITGTDTGVGKTVVAALLARWLAASGRKVAALKPLSSGDRGDARLLYEALGRTLPLNRINPWHFRTPVAPVLAARRQGQKVLLREVLAWARQVRAGHEVTLIEGAGGLLSPLGEDFDSRDLLLALRAWPVVVCPNRLGSVNQALLALAALPPSVSRKAAVVLVNGSSPDPTARLNPALLGEYVVGSRILVLPWLREGILDSPRGRHFAAGLWACACRLMR